MLAPKVLRCLVYHHRQQVHQLGPVHGGLTSDYAPVHVVGLQVAPGGRQGLHGGQEELVLQNGDPRRDFRPVRHLLAAERGHELVHQTIALGLLQRFTIIEKWLWILTNSEILRSLDQFQS